MQFTVDTLLGLAGAAVATTTEYVFVVLLFPEEVAGGGVFHSHLCSKTLV